MGDHPTRRTYSKAQQAEALVMLDTEDGNAYRVARDLDIPRPTVQRWKERVRDGWLVEDEELRNLYLAQSEGEAQFLRRLWTAAATHLLREGKLQDASVGEINAVFGTAFDKWSRVTGQAKDTPDKVVQVLNLGGEIDI